MDHEITKLIGVVVLMLLTAKLCSGIAKLSGQPTVLGELIAGILLSPSVFGVVDPNDKIIQFLSELGIILLLFAIGLETNLKSLVEVGGTSMAVAIIGVALPFVSGYFACRILGLDSVTSIVAGASLTATSVGITARVLSDLGRLQEPESQVILGAAVLDDIIGLIILTVVVGITSGEEFSLLAVGKIALVAFGFLTATLVIGNLIIPRAVALISKIEIPGTVTKFSIILALGLAWLADFGGSAVIIGAFAAGLLLARTPQVRTIEHGITELGYFFVPLFFVTVGASIDIRVFNPLHATNHQTLYVGGVLVSVAVIGKFAAGYAAPWFKGNKRVIGVGMIPRGEVGLIFAQMGLASGVFDAKLFGAVTLMVMATTFIAPPLLRMLLPPKDADSMPPNVEGIEELAG